MQVAQFYQVQPGQIQDPLVGFGLYHIQIQGGATCEKNADTELIQFKNEILVTFEIIILKRHT